VLAVESTWFVGDDAWMKPGIECQIGRECTGDLNVYNGWS